MSNDLPIEFTELTNLVSDYSVDPSKIDFKNCTLSENCISIKDDSSVSIIPLKSSNSTNDDALPSPQSLIKKNMNADSIIMHPNELIIGLKSNQTMQIFNLAEKKRLNNYTLPSPNETVLFWKWINPSYIVMVSNINLYLWNAVKLNSAPILLTQKNQALNNCQIINISANKKLSWFAINGIYQDGGKILGKIQLFSKERNISQIIDGHVSNFATFKNYSLFIIANKPNNVNSSSSNNGHVHIIEIDHDANFPPYQKKNVDLFFPQDAANDFPISCQVSEKYGIIYILSKHGFIHLYDVETAQNLFVNRISIDPIFTAVNHKNGLLTINKKSQLLLIDINKNTIIPYVLNKLSNVNLALSLAQRGNFPGCENIFNQQFQQALAAGEYDNAATLAASSPQLRTPETINKLKNIQPVPGQISPILKYFSILLDNDKLNKYESIELAKPVLTQNKKRLFENWLSQSKLSFSEELGDITKPHDTTLALKIYLGVGNDVLGIENSNGSYNAANSNSLTSSPSLNNKIIICLVELGQFDKIVPYCTKINFKPNFLTLTQMVLRSNPDKAVEFANELFSKGIISNDPNSDLSVEKVTDSFFSQNFIQQGTAFLLEALKSDQPSEGRLQTRLLEINLLHAPQVAEAILSNNMFNHYDRPTVAKLCESAGLFQKALENYTDLKDIKRCIVHTEALPIDWLINYFGQLNIEQSMACLRELLDKNIAQNLQIVIQVATKYSELIGSDSLIKLFEEFKCSEGLYYYLASIVNLSQDENVVFKYIQSACKLGQFKEVERIVRENNYYNGEKVKNFLKEQKLQDQLPLVVVCDRFNFVHDLVLYLYKNQFFKFIEVYVQQVNPSRTPEVVAGLLDVDCDENIIKNLLASVLGQVPLPALVELVEKRNRLKLLLPYLEGLLNQRSQDVVLFNTLAKIYIDSNNNPEKFLQENNLYNTVEVGRYCEKRDPYLAYICYSKGQNDEDLIRITNYNSMFKYQARYLLERSDLELYSVVLSDENMYRRQLIDQLVGTAIPELTNPDPVSIAVKAFMDNNLPMELIELLEKIILEPDSTFNDNASLQGLLILTAVKAYPAKVMGYVEKLDRYDAKEIAPLCIESGLNEEAFHIYDKFELKADAMKVLIEDIMSLDRGEEYAEKLDETDLWFQLGTAQLNGLRIDNAISSYIKSNNPSNYSDVIDVAEQAGKYEELVPYLRMARQTLSESKIDGELILCLAELDQLQEISIFLNSTNTAQSQDIGDKLFDMKNYKAAKLLYENISNYSKLASTLVYLKEYQEAVDCARKASNIKVWKQVNTACIASKEFRLAQICGLNLIIDADELEELVEIYETNGYFDELISLFESGLGLERAHMGMFTELAILYSKYIPAKTMEHLKLFWSRINIPKVLKACKEAHLWPELIFLYCHYDEWDNAVLAVIDRSADAFDHQQFKEIIVKVSNLEIYYKGINFYMNEHPDLIVDLLSVMVVRVDIGRVVRIFQKSDNLPMIKPFLISVLDKNNSVVNEAYHQLLIEEEDYKTLRVTIDAHDRFDSIDLAYRLEKHELIFFRQISAYLYRKNNKYNKAISILKEDRLWTDLIETVTISKSTKICHELLEYFVEIGNRECFVALLYVAYNLAEYDFVLELSWLHNLGDYIKPYEISIKTEQNNKINELFKDLTIRREKEKKDEDTPVFGNQLLLTSGPAPLAVPQPAAPILTGFNPNNSGLGFQATGAGFGNIY
ncbi:clathrin heavy chain [Ascoidea rubescens DSM 1968]|uniref:Clathrin heavy chain n=1 Tax=Ascoidea rubescens DSM 1968 TaxID=1344418 RepID=A0A1D2VMH3_9ASCO|nr:clathrin heavy chain [Ascoidea rubescens DSM 1968]ODV62818.1 clathrin heavy chain [Ascoidea rubescens DSM 1968]